MKTANEIKKLKSVINILVVLLFSMSLEFAYAQYEGTMEKAGKKLDQAGEKASKKTKKAGDYLDDSAITAKIKAEILSDPLLKVSDIKVITTKGVVELSGTVDSQQSVNRALEIANSLGSVSSVRNEMQIKTIK
jgi:hyperosmotically inducible protein